MRAALAAEGWLSLTLDLEERGWNFCGASATLSPQRRPVGFRGCVMFSRQTQTAACILYGAPPNVNEFSGYLRGSLLGNASRPNGGGIVIKSLVGLRLLDGDSPQLRNRAPGPWESQKLRHCNARSAWAWMSSPISRSQPRARRRYAP